MNERWLTTTTEMDSVVGLRDTAYHMLNLLVSIGTAASSWRFVVRVKKSRTACLQCLGYCGIIQSILFLSLVARPCNAFMGTQQAHLLLLAWNDDTPDEEKNDIDFKWEEKVRQVYHHKAVEQLQMWLLLAVLWWEPALPLWLTHSS